VTEEDVIICKKCSTECYIEGEHPRYTIHCETCNDFPEGFGLKELHEYTTEKCGDEIDGVYDSMREAKW